MPPQIATIVYVLGIIGLFWLDRDPKARTSKALWIPTLWLLISGSRPVSAWLALVGLTAPVPKMLTTAQYVEGSPIDRDFYTMMVGVSLIVLFSRGRKVGALLRNNWPILLFFSYCALSVLWSDYTFVAFKRWTKGLGDLLVVLVVLSEVDPVSATKRLLARMAFILVPISLLFVKYYPDLGREYNPWTWAVLYSGITQTKNELGMLCVIFGLGSLWLFLVALREPASSKRTRQLIAHGALLTMVLWLFRIANSMTSLSCFLLAASVLVITSRFRAGRSPRLAHPLVAAIVLASSLVLFSGAAGGLLSVMGRDATLTGRTGIWDAVLSVSGNPLLGTGYESFWLGDRLPLIWAMTMKGLQEAHNGYLEVYLNLGWVGVALLAVLIATGYRNALAAIRRDPKTGSLWLAYFVVAIIYNFTEAGFRETDLVWIFFLFAISVVPQAPRELEVEIIPSYAEASEPITDLTIFGASQEIF